MECSINGYNKVDIVIMLLFLIVPFILLIPYINVPLLDDGVYYTEISEKISKNWPDLTGKATDGATIVFDLPPIFPLMGAFFVALSDNPLTAMRMMNAMMLGITLFMVFIISRRLGISRKLSICAPLLMLTNPFFFQFTSGLFVLTESTSMVFLLLGIHAFFFGKPKYKHITSSVFFVLAVFTRYMSIFIIAPFLLYYLIKLFKEKKKTRSVVFMLIIVIPIIFWVAMAAIYGSPEERKYNINDEKISISKIIMEFPRTFMINTIITPLLTFLFINLFIIPKIYLSILRALKRTKPYKKLNWLFEDNVKDKYSIIILLVIALYSLSTSLAMFLITTTKVEYSLVYIISRTRFFIVAMPLIIILGMIFMRYDLRTRKLKLFFNAALVTSLALSTIICITLNSGYVQDRLDGLSYIENTYVKRNYHRTQALEWFDNKLENKRVGIFFMEPVQGDSGINIFSEHYLKKNSVSKTGLEYVITDEFFLTEKGVIEMCGNKDYSLIYSTESPAAYVFNCING
ncbi:glycosyltransferase family 39 protein [Candidatus Woesearchaeota archaeon]|nr:glycosyltransferase family 39 protein [Candidatus Woesearchaeota archaeon]